jgi:hypothetical protein
MKSIAWNLLTMRDAVLQEPERPLRWLLRGRTYVTVPAGARDDVGTLSPEPGRLSLS